MFERKIFCALAVVAFTATAAYFVKHDCLAEAPKPHGAKPEIPRYGLGRPAAASDFSRHDYLVGPRGSGLPKGHGTAAQGRAIYMQSCVACHGLKGEGTNEYPALAGGKGTLRSNKLLPTIGSYWPYATTVWDYVNRAMPYQSPGSLKPDEVYAVTAHLLAMNGIVSEYFELNERTLPQVRMPNFDGFVPDPRPDVK
jgi:S-disulfanyl-L-cysteine oxidoreductase SoxD